MNRKSIRDAGKRFGYLCIVVGINMVLLTMPFIANDNPNESAINIRAMIVEIIGVLLYLYGAWRTGYNGER
jgi:hypothetical protein